MNSGVLLQPECWDERPEASRPITERLNQRSGVQVSYTTREEFKATLIRICSSSRCFWTGLVWALNSFVTSLSADLLWDPHCLGNTNCHRHWAISRDAWLTLSPLLQWVYAPETEGPRHLGASVPSPAYQKR